jgi:hypothetical protein
VPAFRLLHRRNAWYPHDLHGTPSSQGPCGTPAIPRRQYCRRPSQKLVLEELESRRDEKVCRSAFSACLPSFAASSTPFPRPRRRRRARARRLQIQARASRAQPPLGAGTPVYWGGRELKAGCAAGAAARRWAADCGGGGGGGGLGKNGDGGGSWLGLLDSGSRGFSLSLILDT